jgi:D-alanyl-D-alanine carboxypeptidase
MAIKRPWVSWLLLQTACTPAVVVQGSGAEHARRTLQTMLAERELPGAQYVVVTEGETLLDLELGRADAAGTRPMARETLQMAYSITKALTAVAVLQLVQAGKLQLQQPLATLFAAHSYGPGVTVGRLLAHTAGISNPMPLDWFAVEGEALDRDARLRAVLDEHPELDAEPGAQYRYSNVGYWLLEKAIEAASGQDYAEYMRQHVFAPAGIPATAATFELPAPEAVAVGHSLRTSWLNPVLWALTPSGYWATAEGRWSRAARLLPHGRGYGGLFCNAAALARVLQDLLRPEPRLLSPSLRDEMFAEQRTNAGERTAASLGWVVGELDGVPYVGKQGGGFGFHGNVRIYRTLGFATVLLANRTEIAPSPIDARSDALDLGFVRERKAAGPAPR